jgi:DUF218 domain
MITRHLYFVLLCISLSMPAFAQNTVAIVPGCPTEADGSLSLLQWQRVVWGWFLWASGTVDQVLVSGNAVANPFNEAETMAAGLRSLGLPEQDILVEPQALHTDENIAYALRMLPADAEVIVASHSLQAPGGCDMVRAWSSHPCSTRVIDFGLVMPRIRAGLPTVRGTAQESWVPLRERERRIAEQLGVRPRPSSLVVYARGAFLRIFGKSQPPMLLPANQ